MQKKASEREKEKRRKKKEDQKQTENHVLASNIYIHIQVEYRRFAYRPPVVYCFSFRIFETKAMTPLDI